jgi:cellulose biosynthesis protein BcsQ
LAIALVASSPKLREVERELIQSLTEQGLSLKPAEDRLHSVLKAQIGPLREQYEHIIFDCPPGISMLTEVAIRLSDATIIPTVPDFLSLLGLDNLAESVWKRFQERGALTGTAHVLVTRRFRYSSHDAKVKALRERAARSDAVHNVFDTEILHSRHVPRSVERIVGISSIFPWTQVPTHDQTWDATMRSSLDGLIIEIDRIRKNRGKKDVSGT